MSGRKIESKLIGHIFLPGIFLLPLTVLEYEIIARAVRALKPVFGFLADVANLGLREYNADL
jgi:hypothetical protein